MRFLTAIFLAITCLTFTACTCSPADNASASQLPFVKKIDLTTFDDWTVFTAVIDQRTPTAPVISNHHVLVMGAFPADSHLASHHLDFSRILLYSRFVLPTLEDVEYFWLPSSDPDFRLLVVSWPCGGTAGNAFQIIQASKDPIGEHYAEFTFEPIVAGFSNTRPYATFVSPDINTIHIQLTNKFAPPHTLIIKDASSGYNAQPLPRDYQ